ncbi:MAG TPA: O-antigen ligase family protein, partial [Rugosimonospora sp.]|nr:O-antigen ligase family protein [Rugosimonospora sp.]
AAGVAVALLADRPLRRQLYLAAAGAIGYLVLANVHPALREMLLGSRSTAELSTNNAIRAAAARVALDVVVQHPLRGVGYGLFAYVAQLDPRLHTFINTHNDYLRLAAETGVLSTVLLVAVLGAAFFAGTGSARLPIRAAVAAGAVTLAFANTLSSPIVSSGFWVCLGCLLASRERRSSRPK